MNASDSPIRSLIPILILALPLGLLSACGEGEGAAQSRAEGETAAAAVPSSSPSPSASAAPVLEPTATFPLADDVKVTGVAMAPDGSRILVTTQERLGAPVTLRLYDASTGAVLATAGVDGVGLWGLHWMSDNRLVAADRDAQPRWRAWDGSTLEPLPTLRQDLTCADGRADRSTGAVYSTDGMASMSDNLCRFDTKDGSVRRTAAGVLVGAERFWVRDGEVAVLHSPDPDVSLELVTLDGATLARTSALPVPFGEIVEAVGNAVWIRSEATRTSRLEPGAIPVPNLGPLTVSRSGRFFVHSNGMDDFVFVSATDGEVLGTMPAGMNLSAFADWSMDDTWFVRLTVDRGVEVFQMRR